MKKITFIILFLISLCVQSQTISHSTAMTLSTGTVSCGNTVAPATSSDNNYYRFFELNTFSITGPWAVSSVQFGIQVLTIPGLQLGFPINVRIWSTAANDFPSNFPTGYTLVTTSSVNITTPQLGTLVSIPIVGTIPAGQNLLVTIDYAAQTTNSGNRIVFSANSLGQTAPTYLSSAGCSITVPTDLTNVGAGFPTSHLVLSVTGTLATKENVLESASVFPNPSNGVFTIDLKSSTALIEKVSLTDISGKQMAITLDANNSFDISSYNTGIYILNLQTSEGVLNKRLIKE